MKPNNNHEEDQLPVSELNSKEKQMLQVYQDREYLQRWEKVIETNERKERRTAALKWVLALAVLASVVFFFFGENKPEPAPAIQPVEIAGLVDYPFMEQQIRGTVVSSDEESAWKESISLYKKGAYTQALETSQSLNRPFFKGMCLLHLQRYEASLQQFDLALQLPDYNPEINYYKGFVLMQLGRNSEAKAQFNLVLESRQLREDWKISAKKMMGE